MENYAVVVFILNLNMIVSGVQYYCGRCTCTAGLGHCLKADCSNLQLQEIPTQIPTDTCMLDLSRNFLTVLKNGDFDRFINLTTLNLSSSFVVVIEKHAFTRLRNLEVLHLQNNSLSRNTISKYIFEHLTKLRELDISGNMFVDYADYLMRYLVSLEALVIDGIYNASFGTGFASLKRLKNISLSGSVRGCRLGMIHRSVFVNVKRIEVLNVSNCRLNKIEPGALSVLQQIKTLDLSNNRDLSLQGAANATYGLETSTIRHLIVNQIVKEHTLCVIISGATVQHLTNSKLETIEANNNGIQALTVSALKLLPKSLKILKIHSNRFEIGAYLYHLDELTNLERLEIPGHSDRYKVPVGIQWKDRDCAEEECERHTTVAEMDNRYSQQSHMMQTHLSALPVELGHYVFKVPPKLTRLISSYMNLCCMIGNLTLSANILESIDLSYNILTAWYGYVHGVEQVKYLNLSNNICKNVSKTFFKHFTSLEVLNVSKNFLRESLYHDQSGEMFRYQENLVQLDLSHNVLFNFSKHFLQGMKSLRVLDLSWNEIYEVEFNLEDSPNLAYLNFKENQINYLRPHVRKSMDRLAEKHNFTLNLAYNPLLCTCDHLDFFEWLVTSKVQLDYIERYDCIRDDGSLKSFQDYDDLYFSVMKLRNKCKVFYVLSMCLLATVILVTSVIMSAIFYRFRWRLIYLFYTCKRRCKSGRKAFYDTIYDFNAFVSYADENRNFVISALRQQIESDDDIGVALYLRDRDSMPGVPIAENIIDGIQRSKKSILLLSRASIASKWCWYELNMANMEGISTRRDVMIIVMLEDIPAGDIPPEIIYHIQNSAYIQYPDDETEENMSLFWNSLIAAIQR